MIAKIIKGADFGGVINYMLSKQGGKLWFWRVIT